MLLLSMMMVLQCRLNWQLAMVKELQWGQDNAVRSATIRTVNSVTSRLIIKLYPSEVNVESEITVGTQKMSQTTRIAILKMRYEWQQ